MFEIYFSDLNEDAQNRFLEYMKLDSAKEGNYDIDMVPIAVIDCCGDDTE